MPPPVVRPPMPTDWVSPVLSARPCACAGPARSPEVAPGSTRAVCAAGSISMCFISDRSMTKASSTTLCRAMLRPPLRQAEQQVVLGGEAEPRPRHHRGRAPARSQTDAGRCAATPSCARARTPRRQRSAAGPPAAHAGCGRVGHLGDGADRGVCEGHAGAPVVNAEVESSGRWPPRSVFDGSDRHTTHVPPTVPSTRQQLGRRWRLPPEWAADYSEAHVEGRRCRVCAARCMEHETWLDRREPFGERLRRYREVAGYSQEQLASRAGLSANAVGALERGERKRPYPDTLRRLADALDLGEEVARLAAP